jgi:hypothetical protein
MRDGLRPMQQATGPTARDYLVQKVRGLRQTEASADRKQLGTVGQVAKCLVHSL